jgi:ABC-2 type transport system ATP-binding protein
MEFLNGVLGLEEFFDKPVRTLSLGQRMRADLGAALLHNPKVLYLDEPTIGLDLVVKDNIRKAIKEINEKYQTTVILTTHDIGDIEELCNRIIIIDHGKIIYDGTLSDLKDKYGKKRKVTLVVKDMSVISKGDYAEKFGMKKDSLIIDKDEKDSSVSFTFDKDTLAISDIVTYTLEKTEVMDMNIRETELSEIVKEIYNHKIMENENETGI